MNIKFRRKDLALPFIACLLIVSAIVIQFHNYLLSSVPFQFEQIHHESFAIALVFAALILLLIFFLYKPEEKKIIPIKNKHHPYRFVFYIIGAYVIFDGLFSILIYPEQPVFPDQSLRIIRMIVGGVIICLAEKS